MQCHWTTRLPGSKLLLCARKWREQRMLANGTNDYNLSIVTIWNFNRVLTICEPNFCTNTNSFKRQIIYQFFTHLSSIFGFLIPPLLLISGMYNISSLNCNLVFVNKTFKIKLSLCKRTLLSLRCCHSFFNIPISSWTICFLPMTSWIFTILLIHRSTHTSKSVLRISGSRVGWGENISSLETHMG
jgi:hypothetical protein